MTNKIISPCISICKTDPVTGYCYGCARTNEEKINWKDEKTSNSWKEENLKIILGRMQGWQLETFKESYKFKKDNGISLFKKKPKRKKIIKNLFSLNPYHLNGILMLHLKVLFLVKKGKLKKSCKYNMKQNLV